MDRACDAAAGAPAGLGTAAAGDALGGAARHEWLPSNRNGRLLRQCAREHEENRQKHRLMRKINEQRMATAPDERRPQPALRAPLVDPSGQAQARRDQSGEHHAEVGQQGAPVVAGRLLRPKPQPPELRRIKNGMY